MGRGSAHVALAPHWQSLSQEVGGDATSDRMSRARNKTKTYRPRQLDRLFGAAHEDDAIRQMDEAGFGDRLGRDRRCGAIRDRRAYGLLRHALARRESRGDPVSSMH